MLLSVGFVRGGTDEQNLTRVHRLALRLVALGADDELVAECLGIEPQAVAPLVKVARAKAAAVGSPLVAATPTHPKGA